MVAWLEVIPTGKARTLALFMALVGASAPVRAYVTSLPESLAHEALSETVPTAFAAFDLQPEDYVIEWEGGPAPAGLTARLLPGTIQWVRVADVLVLPRARLRVELITPGTDGARASNAGFSQGFAPIEGGTPGVAAELPVALISGERNPIDIVFTRRGVSGETRARARLKFKPRAALGEQRVFYDASCSRFGVRAEGSAQSAKARGWAYVGCRVAEVEGAKHRTSSLEAWVFWDGVGQSIRIEGTEAQSSSVSVWPLRLRSDPGQIKLAAGADSMTLHYSTPSNFHRAFIGLGLGPYWDHFVADNEVLSTPAPMATLYGSYFLTESLRMVGFGAALIDRHFTTDLGVYLSTEYVKFMDRRVTVNLLLGVHGIGFRSQGKYNFKLGLPQGAEVTIVDFFKKGHNLTGGLFLYPLIAGVSYYNMWLRWGSPRLFWEFNYISWDETYGAGAHSDSMGLSVGFPIVRFL